MDLPLWIRSVGQKRLAEVQVDNEGSIQLGSITSGALQHWTFQNPEVANSDNIRYEYNYLTERFIVKFSLSAQFGAPQMRTMVRVGSGTTFKGFTGDWSGSSQKLPDAYIMPLNKKFPTVVCEAGFAESMEELKEDAKLWLLHTGGQTRIVIVLCLTETNPKTRILAVNKEAEENDDCTENTASDKETTLSTQESADDEQILLNSIDESTDLNNLAEQLFVLNQEGKLMQPLVGNLKATLHVFKAVEGGQSIEESFVATLLPPPTADSDRSEPTEFRITMQDMLDNCLPKANDPTDEIAFSLAVLQEYIQSSIPHTERLRAAGRAEKLLKALGGLNNEETFGKRKRQRLGPIGVWK